MIKKTTTKKLLFLFLQKMIIRNVCNLNDYIFCYACVIVSMLLVKFVMAPKISFSSPTAAAAVPTPNSGGTPGAPPPTAAQQPAPPAPSSAAARNPAIAAALQSASTPTPPAKESEKTEIKAPPSDQTKLPDGDKG